MMVFEAYAPFFTLLLIVVTAASVYGLHQIHDMENKQRFYHFAEIEIAGALSAAERVLHNSATPVSVRRAILTMLNTLADEGLGRAFMNAFSQFPAERGDDADDNDLAEAMERLHGENYPLAIDAHKALMGIALLAIPLKQADRVDIIENVSKGAIQPDTIFHRVGEAARRLGDKTGVVAC